MDYYKETKNFKMFNPNPTESQSGKSKKGDCVIRAFAIAADLTWLEAFDLLVANARLTYNVPNDKHNYTEVFKQQGYESIPVKIKAGKKRMTVLEFCKKNKKGRFILRLANHLTAVVDGVIYDSWNTSDLCIYKYWKVNINK